MLYDVKYKCGHTERVQIYGTNVHGERDRQAEACRSRDCDACRAAAAREAGLQGSDKQVTWAMDIRAELVACVEDIIEKLVVSPEYLEASEEQRATALSTANRYLDKLKGETSARWLIDNRTRTGTALLAAIDKR